MTAATAKPEAGTVAPAIRALLRRLLPFAAVFLVTQLLVRLTLAYRAGTDYADDAFGYVAPFLVGAWFDLVVFTVFAVPAVLWWLAMPRSRMGDRLDRWATLPGLAVFVFVCLFSAVAEHLFWTEFATRFNFIAVDYLVYTNEVIGNITQSYPVGKLVAALVAATAAIAYLTRRWLFLPLDHVALSRRLVPGLAALALPVVLVAVTPTSLAYGTTNAYGKELSLNGSGPFSTPSSTTRSNTGASTRPSMTARSTGASIGS